MRKLLTVLLALGLSACAAAPEQPSPEATPLTTLYSYRLVDATARQPVSLAQVVAKLEHADVIFIGEFHGHHGSHLLQMEDRECRLP